MLELDLRIKLQFRNVSEIWLSMRTQFQHTIDHRTTLHHPRVIKDGLTVSFGLRKRSPIIIRSEVRAAADSLAARSAFRSYQDCSSRAEGFHRLNYVGTSALPPSWGLAPKTRPYCVRRQNLIRADPFFFRHALSLLLLQYFVWLDICTITASLCFRLYDTPLHSMIMSSIIVADLNNHSSLISLSFCQSTIPWFELCW